MALLFLCLVWGPPSLVAGPGVAGFWLVVAFCVPAVSLVRIGFFVVPSFEVVRIVVLLGACVPVMVQHPLLGC